MSAITKRETPKRRMKETLFTRHRNTVEPLMLANNRESNTPGNSLRHSQQGCQRSEKKYSVRWSSTPNQRLRKRPNQEETCHPRTVKIRILQLLGSYKSRIKKDASLDVCADCGKTPHDVKHIFACPAHPTTLIPSDLWSKPVESIREFSYLEEGSLD